MSDLAGAAPLIVTLTLDADLLARLERDRQAWFPPERNVVPAHVSLFHHLPGEQEPAVSATIASVCASTAPFPVTVSKPVQFGRGVAYRLECASDVHAALARAWAPWLTPQDKQSWRPHVTVQNKVDPAVARRVYAHMMAGFEAFGGTATGIRLWRYLGGPWELVSDTPFRPAPCG